ncbi:MAG: hypothetical protein COB85_09665 [Bacteroidetes bacterium]|nr:MAG: hypothetical protein COB85_09665 [Bacteroidota bacterium]
MLWRFLRWLFSFSYNRNIHGSARFATGIWRLLVLARWKNGLVIDGVNKISLKRSYAHCCVLAPSGTGKTTRFIIPNVLNLKKNSAVITDPSGEIYDLTAPHLRKIGYQVKVLNVADVNASLQYNSLHRCHTHTEIQKTAEILVEAAYPKTSFQKDAFWNDGAKQIINICIRALKSQKNPQDANLFKLKELLNMLGYDTKKAAASMKGLDQATFNDLKAFISQDDKVFDGMLSTAKAALGKLSDPNIAKLTEGETLDFESLRTDKTVIFIIVPEHEVQYYSFIISLLYSDIFNFCMQKKQAGQSYIPVMFFLDEFGNSGKLPSFSTIITTLRKRKCSISIVLQDIQQLVNTYGQSDASTILNGGCSSRIYYPGLSLQTCEELSRMLGSRTISYREGGYESHGDGMQNRYRNMGRLLLTPDEIRTLKSQHGIFVHGNELPIRLKTVAWFESMSMTLKTRT